MQYQSFLCQVVPNLVLSSAAVCYKPVLLARVLRYCSCSNQIRSKGVGFMHGMTPREVITKF